MIARGLVGALLRKRALNGMAAAFLVAITAGHGKLCAQPQTAAEQVDKEQAFSATPLDEQAQPSAPNSSAPAAVNAGYRTLAGVELEGVNTHSILMNVLRKSPIYRESLSTGLLKATIAIPGQIGSRDEVPCTATLIDSNVVMTAHHCFPGVLVKLAARGFKARDASVVFGYDSESSKPATYTVKRVIDADEALDFAILELSVPAGAAMPGDLFGYVNIATSQPRHSQLRMFHHPYGYFRMVLQDATCRIVKPNGALPTRLYHQCDTRGGSSGAAILGYDLAFDGEKERPLAYAIHIAGRENGLSDAELHFNQGVPLWEVAQVSRYIAKIGCQEVLREWECPEKSLARPISVYFDWDRTDITPEAASELDKLISLYKAPVGTGKVKIKALLLKGYSDRFTSQSYDVGVAERMAQSVRAYLVSRGVPPEIISSVSYGSTQASQERDQQNRRVDIEVDYEYRWG